MPQAHDGKGSQYEYEEYDDEPDEHGAGQSILMRRKFRRLAVRVGFAPAKITEGEMLIAFRASAQAFFDRSRDTVMA